MEQADIQRRLRNIASEGVPAARPLPTSITRQARRAQLRSGLIVATAFFTLFAGAFYAVDASRNLVGPAPMAGPEGQSVIDPPDQAGVSGYSFNAEIIDGRICALFDIEQSAFEEHRATATICDPDPAAVVAIETQLVTLDTDPVTEMVVVAGAIAPEVGRVEIELSDAKQVMQDVPIIPFGDFERRAFGYVLEREYMLDKQGRWNVLIRAFDLDGNLIEERPLCDPSSSQNCRT